MDNKGFTEVSADMETPNNISKAEKPLLNEKEKPNRRVDINILKSKLQESENKEFKKNVLVLSFLVISLGVLGVYLSLWLYLLIFWKSVLIKLWKILILLLLIS